MHVALGSLPNAVFQAARLPFDPGSSETTSYVEGLWSPSLVFSGEIGRLTLTHIPSAISQAKAQRVFLSQAGPRFGTTASSS